MTAGIPRGSAPFPHKLVSRSFVAPLLRMTAGVDSVERGDYRVGIVINTLCIHYKVRVSYKGHNHLF